MGGFRGDDRLTGLFAGGLGRYEALARLIQSGQELPVIQGDQHLPLADPVAGADVDCYNLGGDLGSGIKGFKKAMGDEMSKEEDKTGTLESKKAGEVIDAEVTSKTEDKV